MPIDDSADARARRAELAERLTAENTAREACPDCNHSGFAILEGRILDCHCVVPFRQPAKPLNPETTRGE